MSLGFALHFSFEITGGQRVTASSQDLALICGQFAGLRKSYGWIRAKAHFTGFAFKLVTENPTGHPSFADLEIQTITVVGFTCASRPGK
ncbi:hypothetical protein D3C76_1726710 [compost metagenome]